MNSENKCHKIVENCENASDSEMVCNTTGFVVNNGKDLECFWLESDEIGSGRCKTKVFFFLLFYYYYYFFL
jgi:hypothetical protein